MFQATYSKEKRHKTHRWRHAPPPSEHSLQPQKILCATVAVKPAEPHPPVRKTGACAFICDLYFMISVIMTTLFTISGIQYDLISLMLCTHALVSW